MSILEIVGGALMVILSIAIVIFVLLQEGTKGGGLSALTGGDNDSFFSRNQGRTREAMLYRGTRFCAILFFIVTVGVYAAYWYQNR
jgi:preprotein translocase subunit SecG